MNTNVNVPTWFKPGIKFHAKFIPNNVACYVEEFDARYNTLFVTIVNQSGSYPDKDWNLKYTLWGFERGDYTLMEKEVLNYMVIPGLTDRMEAYSNDDFLPAINPSPYVGCYMQYPTGMVVINKSEYHLEELLAAGARQVRLKQSVLDQVGTKKVNNVV